VWAAKNSSGQGLLQVLEGKQQILLPVVCVLKLMWLIPASSQEIFVHQTLTKLEAGSFVALLLPTFDASMIK